MTSNPDAEGLLTSVDKMQSYSSGEGESPEVQTFSQNCTQKSFKLRYRGAYRLPLNRAKWRGSYRGGELELEAEDRAALDKELDHMSKPLAPQELFPDGNQVLLEIPKLSGNLGCSDAVREALGLPWGLKEPRTMTELQQAFETNALFFSAGS